MLNESILLKLNEIRYATIVGANILLVMLVLMHRVVVVIPGVFFGAVLVYWGKN
jgi:hypothetical protein